jgi:hypothetical protein
MIVSMIAAGKRGCPPSSCYDGIIMMSRTQITLEPETQRRARRRAADLGVSLAEYVRRLVARDLAGPERAVEVRSVLNLGSSGGSDIARNQEFMIAQTFDRTHPRRRRRSPRA